MKDTFGSREMLKVGDKSYEIRALDALNDEYDIARLPYSLKILLETCSVTKTIPVSVQRISVRWPDGISRQVRHLKSLIRLPEY